MSCEIEGGKVQKLLKNGEAARLLGVSPKTLTKWALCGKVKARRDWRGWKLYADRDIQKLRKKLMMAVEVRGVRLV